MSYQSFAKDVAIIGITSVLTSFGGFFLLPIITKALGTYEYGIWAQISVTISLLSSISLMGLSMALVRFLAAEKEVDKIREAFYSIVFIVAFSGIVVSLLAFAISEPLASTFFRDPNASYFIRAAALLILLSALDSIVVFYFRIFRQTKTYAFLILFSSFGQLALTLGFLLAGFGLMGVIAAGLIIQTLIFVSSISVIIAQIGFVVPKFTMSSEYLRYGLPLTPNSLIRWLNDSSDRYVVGIFLGMNAVGIYSAAYAIGSLIQLFVSPIQLILFPELSSLFDEGREEEVKVYLSYSMKYFLFLAIPSVVGLSVLSRAILEIITTPEFAEGYLVIPFVALAGLAAGVFQIIINITHLVKKTQFNLYIHLLASTSNLLLNLTLIPTIGILGAAIAALVSYTLMALVAYYVSSKYITFAIDWPFIAKSVVSSAAMAGIIETMYPKSNIDLLVAVVVGAIVYFAIIAVLGGLSKMEILMFKELFLSLLNSIKKKSKITVIQHVR